MSLESKIVEVIEEYVKSIGDKNKVEAIVSLYAQDAWVEDPVGSEKKVGHQALREFYSAAASMEGKAALESEIRVAGNEAAFAFSLEVNLGKNKLVVKPIDIMSFDDEGKIKSMRAFWGNRNQSMS
jgi:steroid delta-isomerase